MLFGAFQEERFYRPIALEQPVPALTAPANRVVAYLDAG
jgi:hypothetical protein